MPQTAISALKRHRFLSGLRQYKIAEKIGRSQAWLSLAETGRVDVPDLERRRLSKILKVPIEELFPPDDDDEEAFE